MPLRYSQDGTTFVDVTIPPGPQGTAGPTGPAGPAGPAGPIPADSLRVVMLSPPTVGVAPPAGTRLKIVFGCRTLTTNGNASALVSLSSFGFVSGYCGMQMSGLPAPGGQFGNNINHSQDWSNWPSSLSSLNARVSSTQPTNLVNVAGVRCLYLAIGA